jgi:hypothetical protein
MEMIFHCADFAALPKILYQKSNEPEVTRKAAMTVDEILVANLGDSHVEPHLLVFQLWFILTNRYEPN